MKELFTIGADPEVCLQDKDGNLKSAIPYVKGTKNKPQPLSNGGNIQYDNVAMEFGIVPAKSKEEFKENITSTLKLALNQLPKGFKPYKCASVEFPRSELNHREARKFGCDPDFNAWDQGSTTCSPKDDKRADGTLRSFGGHIHVGYLRNSGNEFLLSQMGRWDMIQVMDILHGIRSLLLDELPGSNKRRELYGKAGCYRPTPYGIEYRVLSAYWIYDDQFINEMYDLVSSALYICRENKVDSLFTKVDPGKVLEAINENNLKLAGNLWIKVKNFIREEVK